MPFIVPQLETRQRRPKSVHVGTTTAIHNTRGTSRNNRLGRAGVERSSERIAGKICASLAVIDVGRDLHTEFPFENDERPLSLSLDKNSYPRPHVARVRIEKD